MLNRKPTFNRRSCASAFKVKNWLVAATLAATVLSCGGAPDSSNPKPTDNRNQEGLSKSCQPEYSGDLSKFSAKPSPKRISADQYINAMKSLTGRDNLNLTIDPDPTPEGNVELASELKVTRQWIIDSEHNAWQLAPEIALKTLDSLNCTLDQNNCFSKFIDSLSLSIWRKPLNQSERQRLTQLNDQLKQDFSTEEVPGALVAAFLQAPQFVHRNDIAQGESLGENTRRLSDWQIAESLALFLWRSPPDDELLAAAQRGDLSKPDLLDLQVERMLNHPNASRLTNHFVDQWLDISLLEITNKNEGGWNEEMAKAARLDTEKVFSQIMLAKDSKFSDLFTHNTAFLSKDNAAIFNRTVNNSGEFVELSAEERSGILTHTSFLTAHSKVDGASAIKRGNSVLKQVMCQDLDLPVDIIIPEEPDHSQGATARERLAIHRDNPACVFCHELIDAPGLALEMWDGIGRPRVLENNSMIDPSGEMRIGGKPARGFNTPQELFSLMGNEAAVESCFIKRWYAEAVGVQEREKSNPCGLESIAYTIQKDGVPLRQLLKQLATHPSFYLRQEM